MEDDVIINKLNIIDRCLKRIAEEYTNAEELKTNFTKQDSIILNLQRAIEACIDIGQRVIRLQQLEVPQSARDIFQILANNELITDILCENLKKMIGFINVAVHDYQKLEINILIAVLNSNLQDFISFKKQILKI